MAVKRILQSKLSGGSQDEDAFLHQVAVPVTSVNSEIEAIIQDLRDTMWAYPFCVGISAPQIGSPYAISVVNSSREDPENDLVLLNPKIISLTGKKDKKRESCMSVWGEMAEIERRSKVTVEYRNMNFELQQSSFTGFESRAIQHEIDHLNGILYPERACEDIPLQHASFFDGYQVLGD